MILHLSTYIVKSKTDALLTCQRYELNDSGRYVLDGWQGIPMDKLDSITPVDLECSIQTIGDVAHLVAVCFTYQGQDYMVSTRGNYVRNGSVYVKMQVSSRTRNVRDLMHSIYMNVMDEVHKGLVRVD